MKSSKWLEDINMLATELPRKHKNLFFYKNENEFYEEIANLKINLKYMDDDEIRIEIFKIVAGIRDAHTFIMPSIKLFTPIELYWFPQGIYIVGASEEYKDILYSKILSVNNIDINKVIDILKTIISYENEFYLKSQLPKYFPAIELLKTLKIVDKTESMSLTVEDLDGKIKTSDIKSYTLKEVREKLDKHKNTMDLDKLPLYRKNKDKYYWYEYVKQKKLLYFKYNACREINPNDVLNLGKKIIDIINNNDVEKLIIDLRNNYGGNSLLLEPFIEDLRNCEKINIKGKLFGIVGRETFSSALLNVFSLKEKTNIIFLGESTGGKPNCYGEVESFILKNSRLKLSYSTEYYELIRDDEVLSFVPEVNLELSIKNYINNEDPVIESK